MKVLYLLFALDMLNLSVYIPSFSPYVRSLGATPITLGFINSSAAFISLLWNPIVGSLSDAVGRKGLLIKCMVGSLLGSLVLAASSSLTVVYIGKLIGALGSPVSILLRTIVADVYKSNEEKKTFFDKSAPIISLTFLFGSLLSGFLSEIKNGILSFLVMAIIMGSASVVAYAILPDDSKSKKSSKNTPFLKTAINELKGAILNIKNISWPKYWHLFALKGLHDFSAAILMSNIGLVIINEFNIQGRSMGYFFVMTSVFTIISNILKIKLKKRFATIPDYVRIIQAGSVLSISYLGISMSMSIYVFLFFMATMCMSKAFLDTTLTEMITIQTTEHDRGKVISAFDNLYPFSLFVAPISSGFFAEIFGQRILVGCAAIPVGAAVVLAYRKKNKTE